MMYLVSHSCVLRDAQEQYHNPLCGYVYVYHINSVSIITVYNDSNPQSVMWEVVRRASDPLCCSCGVAIYTRKLITVCL